VGAELQELMSASGRDLPRYQGNDAWVLPLPASFVVDADGYIRGRFIDPDYRKRMAIDDLLKAIRSARVHKLPTPPRSYPYSAQSAIEDQGVKRNNSGSLRIGGHAAARTRGASK